MIWKRWQAFFREIGRKNIGIYAANATFFLLLSLFPAMMLLLAILSYTPLTQDTLLAVIKIVTPSAMDPFVNYLVNDVFAKSGATLLSASAITMAWSASRGVYSLMSGFNGIYGLDDRRGYLHKRLVCLLYTVVIVLALLVTIALYVFGQRINGWLAGSEVPIFRFLRNVVRLRWLVTGVFLIIVFTLIYRVFLNKRIKFRAVLPGAIVAAVGWVVFTYFFSLYLNYFGGGYARIYGSLAMIAISMFWLYICMCILFFGALLNYYLIEHPETLRSLFQHTFHKRSGKK